LKRSRKKTTADSQKKKGVKDNTHTQAPLDILACVEKEQNLLPPLTGLLFAPFFLLFALLLLFSSSALPCFCLLYPHTYPVLSAAMVFLCHMGWNKFEFEFEFEFNTTGPKQSISKRKEAEGQKVNFFLRGPRVELESRV
jgi:hypothetical protein